MNFRLALLAGTALLGAFPALAQEAPATPAAPAVTAPPASTVEEIDEDGEDTIVVTGTRPRGSCSASRSPMWTPRWPGSRPVAARLRAYRTTCRGGNGWRTSLIRTATR